MDFVKKEWKNYPDTSTPIMAEDLNRFETAFSTIADELQTENDVCKTVTRYILNGISALHPEYERSYYTTTATPGTTLIPNGGVPHWKIDKPENGFEIGYDGLLITVDSLLLAPAQYSAADSGTQITIEFHTSFTNGQKLACTLYHKPKSTAGSIAGQAKILADGAVNNAVMGIAKKITDEEEKI